MMSSVIEMNVLEIPLLEADWLSTEEFPVSELFTLEYDDHDKSTEKVPLSRRQMASELLEELERSRELEEPFSGWLEERMDLEVFGDMVAGATEIGFHSSDDDEVLTAPSSPVLSNPSSPFYPSSPVGSPFVRQVESRTAKLEEALIVVPTESEKLLETFELLLTEIQQSEESCHHELPTPPDSPPVCASAEDDIATALLESLFKSEVNEDAQVMDDVADFSLALMDDVSVDEQEQSGTSAHISESSLLDLEILSDSQSGAGSPSVQQSESEWQSESDADWEPCPSSRRRKARIANHPYILASASSLDQQESSKTGPRVSRRPRHKLQPEDRRLRKKEQNKSAATRYRIKKKAELEILLEQETELEQRNKQLQLHHDELANEVRYLKKLMREIFVAKGILKP